VGNFPTNWSEWNGKYRDNVRKFWKGDSGQVAELAYRLTGSSDLYRLSGRRPHASINFVTAHDGFTLRDLVSYNEKHNAANGEDNRDGANDNESWNCGAEGPTDDAAINTLRGRQQRNFLATLFLSQGVPMLTAGDELGRTQQGNNNAYCQDNDLSWMHWDLSDEQQALLAFTRRLGEIRHEHPALRRRRFFEGLYLPGADIKDVTWFKLDGTELREQDWTDGNARSLGMRLAGGAMEERAPGGERLSDDTLLVLLNAYYDQLPFILPPTGGDETHWEVLLDTREAEPNGPGESLYPIGVAYPLGGRSLVILRRVSKD
jgi:glycogen operon protein